MAAGAAGVFRYRQKVGAGWVFRIVRRGGLQSGWESRSGGDQLRFQQCLGAAGQWGWNVPDGGQFPGRRNAADSLVVSYFNGDSIQDLAVANSNGNISVLLGNGNGTFRAALDSFVGGATAQSIDYGDFNGDHLQDLMVTPTTALQYSWVMGTAHSAHP